MIFSITSLLRYYMIKKSYTPKTTIIYKKIYLLLSFSVLKQNIESIALYIIVKNSEI